MILPDMEVLVPRPPKREAIDEIAAQKDGEHGYVKLSERLGHIKDHVYVVMFSGEVQQGSEAWQHLEEVLREVHGGMVCRRRGATQGGRGARGSKGGSGGSGVVIRG